MKQQIGCLLDADENYVMLLSAFMNNSGLFKYKIEAFTKSEALIECSSSRDIVFIVASEDLISDICEISAGAVAKFTETREEEGIYKYQDADSVVKDIQAYLAEADPLISETLPNSNVKIIGIYSPAGRTFKTSLALSLAMIFGQRHKTLYLNFEEFSGLNGILPASRSGLSEALYYYTARGRGGAAKVLTMTRNEMGMDYLSPVVCPDDIADTDIETILEFIKEVSAAGQYKTVILDVGCLIKYPVKLLEHCQTVYIPEPYDCMGKRKIQDFDGYLRATGHENLLQNIIKIPVVYDKSYDGKEISLIGLKQGSMGMLAGRLANG